MRSLSRVFKSHELAMESPRRLSLVVNERDQDNSQAVSPPVEKAEEAASVLAVANAEAEAIVQAARLEAEKVLLEANEQAKALQQTGYNVGREQGYQQGLQDATQHTESKLREAQSLCQQLLQKDQTLLQQSQAEALELAMAIAERVIGLKLSSDDQAVQAALKQVLKAAQGAREGLLRVSAQDFAHIWEKRQEWRSLLPGLRELQIEHDPSLQPGDLVLMTNSGTIDARVAVVQEEIAAQLLPAGTNDGLEG